MEVAISLVKKDDKRPAKTSTPSRISIGLTRSGPLALDGSMQETASFTSCSVIVRSSRVLFVSALISGSWEFESSIVDWEQKNIFNKLAFSSSVEAPVVLSFKVGIWFILCILVICFAVLNHSFEETLDELSFSSRLELYWDFDFRISAVTSFLECLNLFHASLVFECLDSLWLFNEFANTTVVQGISCGHIVAILLGIVLVAVLIITLAISSATQSELSLFIKSQSTEASYVLYSWKSPLSYNQIRRFKQEVLGLSNCNTQTNGQWKRARAGTNASATKLVMTWFACFIKIRSTVELDLSVKWVGELMSWWAL